MSKIYLYISLVVILILIGFAAWRYVGGSKQKVQVLANALPSEITITLRDDGFDPPVATIAVGTSVKWVNATTAKSASVNSDNYPTNRLFPELNLGKFTKGQVLNHVFMTPGTYTYHDQFNSERKGKIIVQ